MRDVGQREPTEADAAATVARYLGQSARSVRRFTTGTGHYVYDVELHDGQRVVARLTRAAERTTLAAAVTWHARLTPLGVPLPRLLAHETAPDGAGVPFMLLERLPGDDLHMVYATLTRAQKRTLAGRIVAIQRAVGTLPLGPGYGFASSYTDPTLLPTWRAVLEEDLARSAARLAESRVAAPEHVAQVVARLDAFDDYLAAVPPQPFLDDTTTKNVIVHAGALSGIVDVDWVCFGDPLFTVALTRTALLAHGDDTDYIAEWSAALALAPAQARALELYTALFCVNLLSELGQRFNRAAPEPVEPDRVARLLRALDAALARIA
jgi:aminoglycoside phosphotransferase (APT) family kinase protein